MIVDKLYIFRTFRRPYKANAPLIVDPNRVLSLSITLESFKPISRWSPQIVQRGRCVQVAELSSRDLEQIDREAF